MHLVADTHVHFYDCYALSSFLSAALSNLPGKDKALLLTERSTERFFERLPELVRALPGEKPLLREYPGVHHLQFPSGESLWIAAGSQIVTAEGIEVLHLLSQSKVPDRLGVEESLSRATEGIAVLPWSPGKWRGSRGALVHQLCAKDSGRGILLGDILMDGVVSPVEFTGRRVLSGSDPLPLPGEERLVGRFGVAGDCAAFGDDPRAALIQFLRSAELTTHGRKLSVLQTAKRMVRWEVTRRLG